MQLHPRIWWEYHLQVGDFFPSFSKVPLVFWFFEVEKHIYASWALSSTGYLNRGMNLKLAILLLHAMEMSVTMCEDSWNCEDGTLESFCLAFAAAAADDDDDDDDEEKDDGDDSMKKKTYDEYEEHEEYVVAAIDDDDDDDDDDDYDGDKMMRMRMGMRRRRRKRRRKRMTKKKMMAVMTMAKLMLTLRKALLSVGWLRTCNRKRIEIRIPSQVLQYYWSSPLSVIFTHQVWNDCRPPSAAVELGPSHAANYPFFLRSLPGLSTDRGLLISGWHYFQVPFPVSLTIQKKPCKGSIASRTGSGAFSWAPWRDRGVFFLSGF